MLACVQGCGHSGEFITVSQPDFTIAATPSAATVVAGNAAPAFGFTVTPQGSFNGAVSVSVTPPTGFRCAPVSCSAVLSSYAASNVFTITPAATVQAGAYFLNFVATSGSISHQVSTTLTVTAPVVAPVADFAFSATPISSSVQSGVAAPAYSFSITPINGFSSAVTVTTAAPAGFTCVPASCSATFTGTQDANAVQLTPAATTGAGNYTINFIAASGSLSHQTSAVLTVTSPQSITTVPPPIVQVCAAPATPEKVAATRTGFAYTGNASPTALVYDATRNRILAANMQYNELDIISPESMTVTGRLPVPLPMGVDITADGKTILVGTQSHYFYRVTADTLCIRDRQYLADIPPLYQPLSPMYPVALADGSVLFRAYRNSSTEGTIFLWTEAGGFTQLSGFGNLNYSIRDIVPSTDRMHAFLSGADSSGVYGRYDVVGGASSKTVAFGSQPTVLAVNQDGTRALIANDCCSFVLVDQNFNTLASITQISTVSVFSDPDFSHFYFKGTHTPSGTILDSSLNSIGSFSQPFYSGTSLNPKSTDFDGAHRILSLEDHGIVFVDVSKLLPVPDANTLLPYFSPSGAPYGAFTPLTPESGLQVTANGTGFTGNPSVTFYEPTQQATATGVTTTSSSTLKLTAPLFSSGCADVIATFPSGFAASTSQAFCYSPVVYVTDGDAGPASGGSTLTLWALGLGSTAPTVTIGGVASSNVTLTQGYQNNGQFYVQTLKVLVPPGTPGDADVVISTSFGSTTLPHAFHYAKRQDSALPKGAKPQQLLLDAPRGRVLITDSANNQLLVYALDSGALLNNIPTGPNPQGISLTPDGTRLLLVTAGDYKVSVLDAATYATEQQATLPSTAVSSSISGPAGPGMLIAAMAGNKAYITTLSGYLQGNAGNFSQSFLYDYDLLTNALTIDPPFANYPSLGDTFYQAASADGSTAIIGALVSHGVGGAFQSQDGAVDTTFAEYRDGAVSANGLIIASDNQFYDNANRWQNRTAADSLIQEPTTIGLPFFYGDQFNANGSLFYRATAYHIRIYDVQHGDLRRTLEVPEGITGYPQTITNSPSRLLAVSPAGQIITVTGAGLSVFTFASNPLALATAVASSGTLTLAGSGFVSGTTVKIDAQAAPATFVSTTQLTLTLPALSAGVHSVTVTNPNGDSYLLTLAFTTQ